MSASSSPSQSISAANGDSMPPLPVAEINTSCRIPVTWLFISAIVWLIIGALFGMIATLNFHSVHFMADCAWFTYGRLHPVSTNALIYGFAAQAGLGVMLWLVAHLGRTRLAFIPGIMGGIILWNVGLLFGVLGIFYGENTGFEWLELPRCSSATLFAAYLMIGLGAVITLKLRRQKSLYISQWFLLAALFWFPWIYSTANCLLVAKPVRGALQAGIDWWYQNNLMTIWFGLIGLAAIFYFIPKVIRKPLQSHYLGVFIFWTLLIFGSYGGIPAGSPLPAWMWALSNVLKILTLVPVIAVALCVHKTFKGGYSALGESRPLKFFLFGVVAYVVGGFSSGITSLAQISKIINFTWYLPAQTQFILYGFFAMTMFGAFYYIVPQLLQTEFAKPGLICLQFGLSAIGILLYALPLAIGGIEQGQMLNDASQSFLAVMLKTLMFLRVSTLGELLMLLGDLVLLLNIGGLLFRVSRTTAMTAWTKTTERVEVIL